MAGRFGPYWTTARAYKNSQKEYFFSDSTEDFASFLQKKRTIKVSTEDPLNMENVGKPLGRPGINPETRYEAYGAPRPTAGGKGSRKTGICFSST